MSSPKRTSTESDGGRPSKLLKVDEDDVAAVFERFNQLERTKKLAPSSDAREQRLRARMPKPADRRVLASKIKASWNGMPSKAQKGLRNLSGVLCYRHSLFQALLHSPKLKCWLEEYHQPIDCVADQGSCIACALRDLVKAYWGGRPTDVTTALDQVNKVFSANRWIATPSNPRGQGDPEEQFTWINETMSKTLPRSTYSIFEATSHMVLTSCIKCKDCGYESKTAGHAEGPMSLPLQPRIKNGDLKAYIDCYMSDILEGYKCNKCSIPQNIKRSQEITHSPDTLLIQLKRFDMYGRKDGHPIPFKSTLDLNEYRAASNTTNSKYELSSVVLHAGSLNSGHYICVAKDGNNDWYEFNDMTMTKSTLQKALHPGAGSRGFSPYLLFFQRKEE